MNKNDNSPFNFDDPGAFDMLDDTLEQTKVEDTLKGDDTFSLGDNSEFDLGEDSDFNFNPSYPDTSAELNEEVADLTEPLRIMECTCPKCSEKTEIDLALMPENGFVAACSSCNKQIHITRESCACRVKRKSFKISCANCGKLLDQQPHCHSCGTIFPDYFVIFDPSEASRKARSEFFSNKWAAIKDLKFSFKSARKGSSQEAAAGYSPQSRTSNTKTTSSGLSSRKFTIPAIILVVVAVLIGGGVFAYNSHRSTQIYAENYFKALYCIKTGVDNNINTCTLLKTEWESAARSGQKFSPNFSNKDEVKSAKLRSEVEKYLQKIAEPPKKFSQANESLTKIKSIYLESESLIQSKPGSSQELTTSIDNLSKKMNVASQELKSNLPDSLKKELEISKLKYRGMSDF